MIPKEKAEELIQRYSKVKFKDFLSYVDRDKIRKSISKQCALIAVDEIIKQWEYVDIYLADGKGELNPNLKYWYEVKKEIEKL